MGYEFGDFVPSQHYESSIELPFMYEGVRLIMDAAYEPLCGKWELIITFTGETGTLVVDDRLALVYRYNSLVEMMEAMLGFYHNPTTILTEDKGRMTLEALDLEMLDYLLSQENDNFNEYMNEEGESDV